MQNVPCVAGFGRNPLNKSVDNLSPRLVAKQRTAYIFYAYFITLQFFLHKTPTNICAEFGNLG